MHGLELAKQQARKSIALYRHGAILIKKGEILGAGFNINHFRNTDVFVDRPTPSHHAEERAMVGLRHDQIRGSTIMVIRIDNNNGCNLKMSKPCKRCLSLMKRKGIRKVIFSTGTEDEFDNILL